MAKSPPNQWRPRPGPAPVRPEPKPLEARSAFKACVTTTVTLLLAVSGAVASEIGWAKGLAVVTPHAVASIVSWSMLWWDMRNNPSVPVAAAEKALVKARFQGVAEGRLAERKVGSDE